jgi:ribosomal protein S2
MKIKNTIKNQNKLLKLKLIKTKIYKKNYIFTNLKIEDIEYRLKKGLQIIYKYHVSGKKILFVGSSSIIETTIKNLLKNTKHMFIPEYLWLNGTITNKQASFANPRKKSSYNKTSKLKNKNNLIVVIDKQINNDIITEGYKTKTPIIFLGSCLNIFDVKSSYKIPGNFLLAKKKIRNNFFLALLKNTLKKSILHKHSNQNLIGNKQELKIYKKKLHDFWK